MYNRSYRYKDPVFSYGKSSAPQRGKTNASQGGDSRHGNSNAPRGDTFHAAEAPIPIKSQPEKSAPAIRGLPFSFDQLKRLDTDDYILIFLIFMLIKDNENPDWPLILSLGYILFDIKEN